MFGQKKQKNKPKKTRFKGLKILGIFVLIFEAFVLLSQFIKPKKWQRFLKNEKREIKELTSGEEDAAKFFHDSAQLLRDTFIPTETNDHKPKVLRPKSLIALTILALVVKFTVSGFLFFTYPTPAELSAIISSNMISLINQSRVEAGVDPLKESPLLAQYAQAKGQDMIDQDYFTHDTPEGKRPWQWIDRSQFDYIYAGENLAMDFVTAEVVHAAFLKSPSHRRNVLNTKYQEVGIAVLEGELAGRQTTLLVEFFGTQRKDTSLALAKPQTEPETQVAPVVKPTTEVAGATVEASPEIINQLKLTPTPAPINEGIIVVTTSQKTSKTLVDLAIEYSNIFFIAFLLFILIALALNVFIKIKVQHASIILQTVVVVALLISMTLVKFHFVEQVAPQILIL